MNRLKRATHAFVLVAGAALAGCSQQDFSRPAGGTPHKVLRAPGNAPVMESADAELRAQKMAEVLSRWAQQSVSEPKDYIIGAGDELTVSIYALEAPDQTTSINRSVAKEGTISLPWIGDIMARGTTLRDLETRIADAYAGRYIKNPQISVQVSTFRSVSVVMTGAIRNPGIYFLTDNRSTVLEMLAKAGGLTADAADEVLVVQGSGVAEQLPDEAEAADEALLAEATREAMLSGDNQVVEISLRRLIDEGDLRLNVEINAGAIITVKSVAQQYVYVLGYVQRPGAFTLKGSQQIDALRAVALAGGLSPTARAENSFLVRETLEGQTIIPVNLGRIARGADPTIYILPGDTLIVGSSTMARLSEFVRPTVGAGMSYTPAP